MPVSGNYGTPGNPNGDIYSSFWEIQWYSGSDPAHIEGDFWGRSDLTSGDKIATLRFNNGNTVVDIPLFPDATNPNSSLIKKISNIQTPNGEAWMPLFENGGAYQYLGYQHGGVRHGVHDRLSALPASAIHQWPLDEGGGTTAADAIGSSTGTLSASDFWGADANFVGGYGLQGDGVDNYVGTGPNDSLTGENAVAISVEWSTLPSSGEFIFSGGFDGTNQAWGLQIGQGTGPFLRMESFDGTSHRVDYLQSNLSTGTKYRIVGQYRSGSWELWVNGSNVASAAEPTGFVSANASRYVMANDSNGSIADYLSSAIVDNPAVYNAALSPSEVAQDYNAQPFA